jgi:quercetin dioxygenase-like cupin family protein
VFAGLIPESAAESICSRPKTAYFSPMTIDPRPGPRASAMRQIIQGSLVFPDLGERAKDPDSLEWLPFHPGVEIHWIYQEQENGHCAALIRFRPGASVPLHEHRGFEHIYVLTGTQCDKSGGLKEGSLMVHAPGTRHSIFSEEGCVVLAIYEKPAQFGVEESVAPVELDLSRLLLAVNGTLMRGLALNSNLLEVGATFLRETSTERCYRLWSINDRHPAMIRIETGGVAVAVELWQVSPRGLASVLLKEPPGLTVGKIKLADGSEALGVLGEPVLCQGQREITQFGGWRSYLAHLEKTSPG